jgi:hypothetical protein
MPLSPPDGSFLFPPMINASLHRAFCPILHINPLLTDFTASLLLQSPVPPWGALAPLESPPLGGPSVHSTLDIMAETHFVFTFVTLRDYPAHFLDIIISTWPSPWFILCSLPSHLPVLFFSPLSIHLFYLFSIYAYLLRPSTNVLFLPLALSSLFLSFHTESLCRTPCKNIPSITFT